MNTTFLYKKGGYRLAGKELFIYFCGKCKNEIVRTKQNYCENCGSKLDWKETKKLNKVPRKRGYEE